MPIALALAALLQTAPAADAPADAPARVAVAAPAQIGDTPTGAPADDYGFVAWCRGALSGHMDIYKAVKPELAKLEAEKFAAQDPKLTPEQLAAARITRAKEAKESEKLDAAQQAAGQDYLKLYARALDSAEASNGALHNRGVEATGQGYRIWSAARASDDRTRMWSYIMWELPARCETAARKLEANSGLLGEAFKTAASDAPAPSVEAAPSAAAIAPEAPPENPTETPAATPAVDAPKAAPAPADKATPAPPSSDAPAAESKAAEPTPPPAPATAEPTPKAAGVAPPPLRTTPQG